MEEGQDVSSTIVRAGTDGGSADDAACLRRACDAFARVAAAVQDGPDLESVAREVALRARDLVGVTRCSIHLRDPRTEIFRGCVGVDGDRDLAPVIQRAVAGVPGDGMTLEAMQTRRAVVVENAEDDARMIKATTRFWRIRSILAVPMMFEDEVIGVIFLDEAGQARRFSLEDRASSLAFASLASTVVVQARRRAQLKAKADASERQVRALRRATAIDDRLSNLVVEGRSLTEVLATLAEVLSKPCAVFGADATRLASASPAVGGDGMVPRLLEAPYIDHPAVRAALDVHAGERAFVVGPVPSAGLLHRYLVAPVVLAHETWGHLVVMEHKTRFGSGDMLMLRRVATLVALHVSTERKAAEVESNAGSSLVSELCLGTPDLVGLQRRADRVGMALGAQRVAVFFADRDPRRSAPSDFRGVLAAFSAVAPGLEVHAATVPGGIAALIAIPEGVEERVFVNASRSTIAHVSDALTEDGLVAAVSTARRGADGYRAAFVEARQVVECLQRFSPVGGPAMFSAADLGVGRLFLATSDAGLVAEFAESTFGHLVEDDTKSDMLATLCAFFDSMGSIRRCAEHLRVHENTIRYRLARVEELTGLAITRDPDAALRARLSLLVLQLQGRLPGSRPAGAPVEPAIEAVV